MTDTHVTIQLNEYERRALQRLLEQTGCATRWKIQGEHSLCNGDWGHQIYHKVTNPTSSACESCDDKARTIAMLDHGASLTRGAVANARVAALQEAAKVTMRATCNGLCGHGECIARKISASDIRALIDQAPSTKEGMSV